MKRVAIEGAAHLVLTEGVVPLHLRPGATAGDRPSVTAALGSTPSAESLHAQERGPGLSRASGRTAISATAVIAKAGP